MDNMNQFINNELPLFIGQPDWITEGLQIKLLPLKLSQPEIYAFALQAALMKLESRSISIRNFHCCLVCLMRATHGTAKGKHYLRRM